MVTALLNIILERQGIVCVITNKPVVCRNDSFMD